MFKREKKVPTIRESLRVIAVVLHRANDIRQQHLIEARSQTALLSKIEEKMGASTGMEPHLQAAEKFNERWQPVIDKVLHRFDAPEPPAAEKRPAVDPTVEIQAAGIRTTADPRARE